MDGSSPSKMLLQLPMLLLPVLVLLAPVLQARPLGRGHPRVAPPLLMLPSDGAVMAAPPPPAEINVTGVGGGREGGGGTTPPSPVPGDSKKPGVSDGSVSGTRQPSAPSPPEPNWPPHHHRRQSTDSPLRQPADAPAGLHRAMRDAVRYVIGLAA
ncbi:hypothetical protein GUJ93_ZPchr0010g10115 [Zizania palustris]|uniref:Uncharacterized protein n=1 Tax=Zizania palustris TaxID=103762 RepID=A0A8J5WBN5_ZIZPA|nr:hypothetical protein GUJ93_ZPchr0010g10115 [Zizania palustris]